LFFLLFIETTFPLPYDVQNIENEKYKKDDRPWVWDIEYEERDVLGEKWKERKGHT